MPRRDHRSLCDATDDESIDQIGVGQGIEGIAGQGEVLAVVRVVRAYGEDEAVDGLEVDGAENRIGFVRHLVGFAGRRAGRKNAAGLETELIFYEGQGSGRAAPCQQVEEVAGIRTVAKPAVLFDVLVEIEATKQEVEGAIEIGSDAQFLREGVDGLLARFVDDVGAGEVNVLIEEIL